MSWPSKIIKDLSFEEFVSIYEEDIYCAYMETGCYYDMESEDFDELEYEAYVLGQGQWAETPCKTETMDTPVRI